MTLDNAGNTLTTARKLTVSSNIQTFADRVDSTDPNDFYSFSLSARSSLNIAVDGLSANADLQLIRDTNSNGLVDSGEVLNTSNKTGTGSESIRRTLDAGKYFIRVYSNTGDTNYNLKVFENFTPTSLEFKLNESTLKATDTLNINSGWVSDRNGISDLSKVDFRIQRANGSWIDVADATQFTVDPNNTNKAGFSYSLSLNSLNLAADTYTLQGIAYDKTGAASNTVRLSLTIENPGLTLTNAKKITLSEKTQTFTDRVDSTNINDFYSFSLSARGNLNLVVDGLSASADVQIIRDANSNGLFDGGEVVTGAYRTGSGSESIRTTLDAGNYFIRVYSQGGNTNYKLKVFENFAPTALDFKLNNTSLKPTDTLSINSAWVSDKNGVSDISKVDFRIQKADGSWIDVADATKFTADSSNANKASFSYSLSLSSLNLAVGTYTLQGIAYDKTNAASNTVKQTFTVTTTPTTTASATVQDWFSQNLLDQQLITLTRNLAADGNLSRQDMLDIFRNVQDDSKVDANEVKDLRTLVGASTRFSMQDPVKWLSTQVANGASVDMAASDFESSLVGRWFLGTVAPTPVFNGKTLTYTLATGNLFGSANEARIGDIDQGQLGDCAFLAALGATFGRQSNDAGNASSSVINSMITDNGDNTYTVRFYSTTIFDPGEAQYVTIDRRIATSVAAKTNGGVLWVALVEKAYAQWREWREGKPGYNIIGNGDALSRPLQFVTGRDFTPADPTNINCFSTIETALANGKAVTAARMGDSTSYIVGNHAYSVTNVYTNTSGEKRFVVRNPWGKDGKTRTGADDGFIDLSFDEFSKAFNYGVIIA
ncbi:Peptidase [Trichormus variabilis ATCC 29413]|uniref:Peptidase n=2 Tax=Anabaena variabilis TaxID=264691 RepID=Q3MBX8_TRIV2|nr:MULTISPECIES: pre-peptidase C-terminal domain-containing protein [Nostocaceae]ABA21508.1 Peptidase [Trichormus variabilis ATCC 29413]MBC1213373.1 pre-peptidase C-terminal domain-containing protein [Trichormus variabilis ARAD]MBC1258117.1 pre-peptidase C-terminal domain-containing protein [Trichormus variabilis V5]MBC1270218.1 pre-peptidase C-terminal domain-containing protein [Trichormus variabilis FSR]MBC1304869.1 pre-peptidase C-terminal domain-containing protein [Trichormus variabilis N2